MKHLLGYFFIFIAFVLLLSIILINSSVVKRNQTFSAYTFLSSSWEKYKQQFINQDGRVIDYSQNSVTTSEGQSYALLRAVWMGDKPEFDLLWHWTSTTMKRPHDHLFGWRWGKTSSGTYGFASSSDQNSAADADEDIALALILASHRWNQSSYLQAASNILPDIWRFETGMAKGRNYLVAGNWANSPTQLTIDPSYFSPYAYRIFATVDKNDDWESLITPGYQMLTDAGTLPLDKGKAVGLPPDWITIDTASGKIAPSTLPNTSTNYGFDALRIPWRIALDYQWNSSSLASTYLKHSFTYLTQQYSTNSKLASIYAHDGTVVQATEDPAIYATSLGFLSLTNPKLAKLMYQEKILTLYSNDTNSFNTKLPYYEQNWVWFGAALYNKQLLKF